MIFTHPFSVPEKIEYKDMHKKIINDLLAGKFISPGSTMHDAIMDNFNWYLHFFSESFDIELKQFDDIFYCSVSGGSASTKRILTFIAILIYELDKDGINMPTGLQTEVFTPDRIQSILNKSVQFKSIAMKYFLNKEENNSLKPKFLTSLATLGLIRKTIGDSFSFTPAVKIFINAFDELKMEIEALNEADDTHYI